MASSQVSLLAQQICDCPEVQNALSNSSHPCSKVVKVQNEMVAGDESMRQRPEPWIGDIQKSRVLFLSSNPGISDSSDLDSRESFPTYKDSAAESADFFTRRFDQTLIPILATFNHPSEPNFLVRCNDGKYRSGMKNERRPQATWQGIHDLATSILGTECDPNFDYALTEIVHCKSKMAEGVEEASSMCVDVWLTKIFAVATAPVIVVIGSKARDYFAISQLGFRADFGSDKNKVYKDLSQRERAIRDIQISDFGGVTRLYIYSFHPTHAISPKNFKDMFGPDLLTWISKVANNQAEMPRSKNELDAQITELTN